MQKLKQAFHELARRWKRGLTWPRIETCHLNGDICGDERDLFGIEYAFEGYVSWIDGD